jgi:hypothetical protein
MGLVSWIVVGGWPRSEWSSLAQSHFGDYPPDQFQKDGLALPGTQADRTEAKADQVLLSAARAARNP